MTKKTNRKKKTDVRCVRDLIDEVAFIKRRIELFKEACELLGEKYGQAESGVNTPTAFDTVLDELSNASENEALRLSRFLAEEVPIGAANHEQLRPLVN